jgi:hypothetical protein
MCEDRDMPAELDPEALVTRFRERAEAVKNRPLPPIAGPERQRFITQQQTDFMDYAIIGDAEASLVDGILVLRVDLRPQAPPSSSAPPASPPTEG